MSEPRLVEARCALCGGAGSRPHLERDGFQVVRCEDCGLRFVNPRLDESALDAEYNDQRASPTPYYLETAPEDRRTFLDRLARLERHRPPGDLLDLGCGPGTMLAAAAERGWRPVGVDLNRTSIQHAVDRGLEAHAGLFPHPALAGCSFDAVTMNDFIEHVPDPVGILREVRAVLRPGGLAFLTTPDAGSLVARLTGASWLHLKPREHLNYFDRAGVRRLAAQAGLEVVWLGAMGRRRSLRIVRDRLQGYSRLVGAVTGALLPEAFAARTHLPINLGDEVGLIARRPNDA